MNEGILFYQGFKMTPVLFQNGDFCILLILTLLVLLLLTTVLTVYERSNVCYFKHFMWLNTLWYIWRLTDTSRVEIMWTNKSFIYHPIIERGAY